MTTFDAFVAAFHEHLTTDPNACLAKGIERHLDELPDPSLEEGRRVADEARELLARLATVEGGGLGFDQRLDLDLARLTLQHELHEETYTFNDRTTRQQLPKAAGPIGEGLHLLLVRDPRPDGERLANATARLEKVPDFVQAALARLERPVARWVAMERDALEGLPGLFATVETWAEQAGFADRPHLRRARAAAEEALSAYDRGLAALPTTTRIHVGDACARQIVATRGIDRSLEELHRTAADFLARNRATEEELRGRLVGRHGLPADTPAEALHEHLARAYRVKLPSGELDDVLRRYEAEREKILGFIAERDLFPIPDDQEMRILRTPRFMEATTPAGAMWEPPPFREGTKVSLVYLTLSEELLDEHTELSIPGMMLHEGIPGHHLQLATAAGHPSVVRRHVDAMEQAEGWTTMLEDYMLDVGYGGELADEMRFIGQRDIARIGARVAIDLFFMTGEKGWLEVGVPCDLSSDDPFTAAGKLLREVTGFVPGRVQAELNWYSQERGYPLSYLTGNRLVWELKADVAAANRGHLEGLDLDRAFHETFLQAGNMPVTFLRRVFGHEGLLG